MPDRYKCVECSKLVTATKNQRYRSHTDGNGNPCVMSSDEIPQVELDAGPVDPKADPGVPEEGRDYAVCPDCRRQVELTRLGYFKPHDETLRGGTKCPTGGTRYRREETVKVDPEILGGDAKNHHPVPDSAVAPFSGTIDETVEREKALAETGKIPPRKTTSPATEKPSSEPSTESTTILYGPTGRPVVEGRVLLQPGYALLQPPEHVPGAKVEMSEESAQIATRFKEIFYSYSNRRSVDNRGAQTTLGPSEIGTPCDRRLAMSLMNVEPVNPGGDGWAAQVGTWGHAGVEEMFKWASANTGRFVTELRLRFPSQYVPKGTTDLLDRVTESLWDFKFMGEWALRKFREEGPSETYRVQAHTYGLGATLAGEKVKRVVILGLPRAGATLDQLFVWSEPFNRKVAEDALKRVDRIGEKAARLQSQMTPDGEWSRGRPLEVAREFPVGDDCRYCPFYAPKDSNMERGCPGS